MELESNIGYTTAVTRYVVIIIAATAFGVLSKPEQWEFICLFSIIILLLILSRRFTESASLNKQNITVKYFVFFTRKELKVPVQDLELKLSKESTFRSPKYFLLKIFSRGKHIYTVDSRHGFEEKELREFSKLSVGHKSS
jgi:hypothetical protein